MLASPTAVGLSVVTILSLGAMGFIATTLLAPPGDPLNARLSSPKSLVIGWLILLSAALGLACLATALTPQPWLRVRRLGAKAANFGTVTLTLMPLTLAVLMNVPTDAGVNLGHVAQPAFRAYLWCALAVSLVSVGRAQSGTSRPIRALQLCAPNVLLLLGSGLALVTSRSVRTGSLVVAGPLAALGLVGLVALPAVLLYTSVEGLRDIRQRSDWLSAVIEGRPRLTVGVLAVKAAVILALVSLDHWLRPDGSGLVSSVPIWLCAFGICVFMVSVFVLNHRVQVNLSDHGRVSRVFGAVIAVALGALVVWAVSATLLQRPLVASAVALLLGTAWVSRHRIQTASPWLSWPVAVSVGTSLSFGSAIPWPGAWSIWQPPSPSDAIQVGIFLAVVMAFCTIGLVVMALLNKNARLLLHLSAVAAWVVLNLFVSRRAPGLSLLNLDIVMLVLVTVAALTWLARRQTQVDGFEVVALVVATFTVWELPLFLHLVPPRLATFILVTAAVGPGVGALVGELWRLIKSRRETPDWRLLGTICLLYALLSALVWIVGVEGLSLMDNLGSLMEGYVLVPLALLLLIAASVRPHSRPPE